MKLRSYLTRLFLVAVVPLLIVSALLAYRSAESARDTVQQSMIDVARTLSSSIDAEVQRSILALEQLGMSPALAAGDLTAFRAQAEAVRNLHGRWSNVVMVQVDGTNVMNLRVPPGEAPPRVDKAMHVEATRAGRRHISDVVRSPTSGKFLTYVSVPVVLNGQARYSLVASMEHDLWTAWLRQQIPAGAIAAIDDRNGTIFARSERPEAFAGKQAADPIRSAYANGREGVVRTQNREGLDIYAGFYTSELTGWHTLVIMPASLVNAGFSRMVIGLAVLVLIGFIITLATAWLMARPLQAGVAQLQAAIARVGRGERLTPARHLIRELDEAQGAAQYAGELIEAARAQLQRRTDQIETLLTGVPMGVYLVDSSFRMRAINPVAQQIFAEAGDVIGRDFNELLDQLWPDTAQSLRQRFRHTLETGEPFHVAEDTDAQPGKPTRIYEWQLNRITLFDGQCGVVCYFRDITAQVQAREEIVRQREELAATDRQKNEFLATLAHELRNPMAPIRYATELIRADAGRDTLAQAREIIERQSAHLSRLLDDLLDLSRISRNVVELKRENLDLRQVLRAAADNARPLLREHGHHLIMTLPAEPLMVNGDSARLLQIVDNLLSNASKYTQGRGSITLTADRSGETAVVKVIDNGIGIAPEQVPAMFKLFSQLHPDLKGAQGGLGIGLAVVRQLVELHGGRIDVFSAGVGRGSTFTVRLPVVHALPAPVTAAPAPMANTLPGLSVLVVDDNVDAAATLALVLSAFGAHVAQAHDGAQALALAERLRPRVVILDIGLPDKSGHEVARAIRAAPWGREMTLVAVTGWGQDEDRARTKAAGFNRHLVKPVDPREIVALLTELAPKPALENAGA